jgi:anti-sigma regulatory factor (Ser/Thr protein kinase)
MPWPGEPITGPFPPADVAVQVSSWAAGLALVTLPALCEEPLYRGAMLREFRVQLGAPCAVLACALLFALAHWEAYGILPRTVLGVAFGYAAVASSSLGPAIACHAVCNGVSLVLAATQHSAGPPWGLPTWLLPAVAWSVGSVFAGCALLGRGEGRRPLRVRSDAAELAGVRAEVEGWAARTGLDPAGVQATVAAVHEAVLNAIEHGNGGDPSRWVTVEFRDAPDRVEIRVGDEGGGVPPESDRQPPPHDRGRGIALMRGLMDDVRFAQGRGLVTLVKTKQGRGVGP